MAIVKGSFIEVLFNLPLDKAFTYSLPEGEERAVENLFAYRVKAPFGRRVINGWVVGFKKELPPDLKEAKPVERIIDKQPLFNQGHLSLARWMSRFYGASTGECLGAMLPGGKREKSLPSLGFSEETNLPHKAITLSDEQQYGVDQILKREQSFFYIHGITGSGKTEVFLQIAQQTLNKGQGVIYLVPEIALSHQLVDDLKNRFGKVIGVLHSHLTPSQRLKEWRRIQSGEASFVIGARSAIFAPLKHLGLIIIDEEHENSYKSGSTPRYHGRQIAMKRCQDEKALLLMGSATPSLEAWHLMDKGVLFPIKLTTRPGGGSLPHITVVDMKKEAGLLSFPLIKKIERTLGQKKQVVLFLNRRGHSYFFHCKSCGYQMTCRQCSVSLTYHKSSNSMVCHYCGYQERPITLCPDCGSMDVGYSGFGTEHVEDQVRSLFPQAKVARLDTDITQKKGVLQETLSQFKGGTIDILLGTQMVAKGLNFPNVSLVGVIMADTGLSLPDFRAAERTFSLIVQVAGRAGRYRDDGEVVIQSFKPESPAIALAATGQWDQFYRQELQMRELLGFPPFSRLFRVVYRGKKEEQVKLYMDDFYNCLKKEIKAEILGPSDCPISFISGNFRSHILIRSHNFSKDHQVLMEILHLVSVPKGLYREVDIDPVQLL